MTGGGRQAGGRAAFNQLPGVGIGDTGRLEDFPGVFSQEGWCAADYGPLAVECHRQADCLHLAECWVLHRGQQPVMEHLGIGHRF